METSINEDIYTYIVHPTAESNQVLLALHGWTGNETTMSILTQKIGKGYWVFQPRGFYPATPEGFGWVNHHPDNHNTIIDFVKTAERLRSAIIPVINRYCEPMNKKINIMGFSQGAALALIYSLIFPEEIHKVAVLAGFMPDGTQDLPISAPISEIGYFISHGIEDAVISIENARKTLAFLTKHGAAISYCEGKGGHRVSAECFKNLSDFFNEPTVTLVE